MRRHRWCVLGPLVAVAGCTVGPHYTAPKPVADAAFWPRQEALHSTTSPALSIVAPNPMDPTWWTAFADPELVRLEQRLAGGNPDVQIYAERLAQSRAQLGVAQADALPSFNANGSYTRELPSAKGVLSLFPTGGGGSFTGGGTGANGTGGTQGGIPVSSAIPPFDLFQYGFDASWELDLWGHARREVEAGRAGVQSAVDEGRSALISAEAELARDYIDMRGLQARIALTNADVEAFSTTLRLTRERAQAGLGNRLDVTNSTAQVASARSDLPQLLTKQAQDENAIALLLGQQPGALEAELAGAGAIPPVPPVVPIGLPSELARRRPDIRAAEARLHTATAEIGVAVADFYPKITLSGSIGLQALQFKDLGNWSARQYGFGPSVSLPIFEGGRLRATLQLRRAQQREAAISYRQTVLRALGEVSDALFAYHQEQLRGVQLATVVQANRQSVALALQRYRQGLSSFIDVLDAQRGQLQAEQALASSTASVSTDLVQLFKALGGGWTA